MGNKYLAILKKRDYFTTIYYLTLLKHNSTCLNHPLLSFEGSKESNKEKSSFFSKNRRRLDILSAGVKQRFSKAFMVLWKQIKNYALENRF